MVDFRKWLIAFAGAALLFGLGSSQAFAQSSAFTCTATGGTPHIVRSEGVAELVGDLILNCTGGVVTPVGVAIPLSNVQVSLNTNVTSRLTSSAPGSTASEAILTIDEPFPSSAPPTATPTVNSPYVPSTAVPLVGATTTQEGCLANGVVNCSIIGTGTAINFGASGPYNGVIGQLTPGPHYNVFQGITNPLIPNQVNWNGVPIDAPGTTGVRIIRITNVRANACMLGVSSTLVPTTITELIGVNGSQTIVINNPLQTVALAEKGLYSSVNAPAGAPSYLQCNSLNTDLLKTGSPGSTDIPIVLSATEGFAAAFKSVSYTYSTDGGATSTIFINQNVLGVSYNTESGYEPYGIAADSTLDQSARKIGIADTGTQIAFTITGIPAGVTLFAPNSVGLVGPGNVPTVGIDGVTGTYANLVTTSGTVFTGGSANPPKASGYTQITPVGTTATITYVVIVDNPFITESLNVALYAAYVTSSSTVPATGTASVAINYAPLSGSTQTASSSSAPIPRFCQPYTAVPLFTITPCTCNLLFPFVTNIAGFDTGVAIANTSQDPYGTITQTGTVSLWYYGTTGTSGPPPMQTSTPIAAGQLLTFQLSSGGSNGIVATPGFQGYMIAQADFQFCHGYAFISDLGAQKLAEGYLALVLDIPAPVAAIDNFLQVVPSPARGGPGGTAPPPVVGENEGQ